MSQVVSIRLKDEQVERLKRFARWSGKSQSEMGAQFIEESMRQTEYALIEFRGSTRGRLAYMKGSNLAVWEVIMIARDHDFDVERLMVYFRRPKAWIKTALNYYEAFPAEIDALIADNDAMTPEKLKRILPQLEIPS
jgi:hypothetical protein